MSMAAAFDIDAQSEAEEGKASDPANGELGERWLTLPEVKLDMRRLEGRRVVTVAREEPAAALFNVLRTRLVRAIKERGWSRIAITSPQPQCGKTFVAANLAFAMSRLPACRSVLLDLDLRMPSLWDVVGLRSSARMGEFLLNEVKAEALLRRPVPNLAVGVSTGVEPDASEVLQHPATARTLRDLHARFCPDLVLYDMPPLLGCDDVVAFAPQVDAVLLVARGGRTTAAEIRECERLIDGQAPLLGVVLNSAEDKAPEPYGYYGKR